jgi:hypothetical protein
MSAAPLDNGDFRTYLRGCVAIEVLLPSGDVAIGTGFQVGGWVVLTARHVLEGNTIKTILAKAPGLSMPSVILAFIY